MSLAVVRCPGCRGASRVASAALGHMVGCPRCQMPFVAEEEVPVVAPVARRAAPRPVAVPAAPRPRAVPVEPGEPVVAGEVPDPEHDPHTRPVGGLPVSVLVGFALVPFGIPLLWRLAPLLSGQEPALSLAVPVSLAIAASALCLGVVYTIDWTATTRVKGVVILVALSYLSAAGLFFLKKDLMDRLRGADPGRQWSVVTLDGGKCRVKMPGIATNYDQWPLDGVAKLKDGRAVTLEPEAPGGPRYEYRVAVSKPGALPGGPDDAWFARVGEKVRKDAGVQDDTAPDPIKRADGGVGREWRLNVAQNTVRVVRVYVIGDRVYYLSGEGPNFSTSDEEHGKPFFDDFVVN